MNTNSEPIKLIKTIPPELEQKRLDYALSILLPQYSRVRIQKWIKSGWIQVDNKTLRTKDKVYTNQTVTINATNTKEVNSEPQPIDLTIIYEDQDIIIINKPPGLVVHPGAGRANNTLLNALLYRYPELATIPRAGIIHRLDKDTSGLLVITRNLTAHTKLTANLQKHLITREYEAIVNGAMISGGTINAPIGRHPVKRTHMSINENGKTAVTHYRIKKRFPAHTHLQIVLETGRTHQIRVHLAHISYPIVGDQTYNKRIKIPAECSPELQQELQDFRRQALHARSLTLTHPLTNKIMKWEIEPPDDFKKLLCYLK